MRFWTRRGRFGWSLMLAAAALGCDGVGSTPPGPPRGVPVTVTPKVALILPAGGLDELDVWEATARREQVRTKTLIDIRRLSPGDPPEKQAEFLRSAVDEGASAVIVMAAEPKAVVKVLEEIRAEGIPVLLLDRDVPLSGTPPPRVTYASDRETARTLVDLSLARALSDGFTTKGPAIIFSHAQSDDSTRIRMKALREELESRGARVLPDVLYTGLMLEAQKTLQDVLVSAPHAAMVFAMDDMAVKATAVLRHGLDRTQRRFVMAGYTHEKRTMELVNYNLAAGLVDRKPSDIIHVAFDTALAMSRGETVPLLVESPTPINPSLTPEKEGVVPPFLSMPEMLKSAQPGRDSSMPVPDES